MAKQKGTRNGALLVDRGSLWPSPCRWTTAQRRPRLMALASALTRSNSEFCQGPLWIARRTERYSLPVASLQLDRVNIVNRAFVSECYLCAAGNPHTRSPDSSCPGLLLFEDHTRGVGFEMPAAVAFNARSDAPGPNAEQPQRNRGVRLLRLPTLQDGA